MSYESFTDLLSLVSLWLCWAYTWHCPHWAANWALRGIQCWDLNSVSHMCPPTGGLCHENSMSIICILKCCSLKHAVDYAACSEAQQARSCWVLWNICCTLLCREACLRWWKLLQLSYHEEALDMVMTWRMCVPLRVFFLRYQVFHALGAVTWWHFFFFDPLTCTWG